MKINLNEWPLFLQTLLCALLANKLLQKCILRWDKLGESLFYWNLSLLIFTQGRRAIANITQVDFPFAWLPHVTNGGKGHLPTYLIHCPLWGIPCYVELTWRHFIALSPLGAMRKFPLLSHQMRSLTLLKQDELISLNNSN